MIGQKGDAYLLITHYVIDGKKFDDSSSDNTLQANENKTSAPPPRPFAFAASDVVDEYPRYPVSKERKSVVSLCVWRILA